MGEVTEHTAAAEHRLRGAPPVGTGPTDTHLPDGWRVVVDRRVVALDGGRVLLGGAPPRMLRLTPAGRALLAGGGFTVTDATSRALARRLLDGGVVHPVPSGGGRGRGTSPSSCRSRIERPPSPACSPRSRPIWAV
jgi:hypothetical protein